MPIIYKDEDLKIETEENELPWLKIFTVIPYKEMSEVPEEIRRKIFYFLHIIEKEMISYYKPTKINIASFGNYLPHVHWHIMARFKTDSYYPEPVWGKRKRQSKLILPSFDIFCQNIVEKVIRIDY